MAEEVQTGFGRTGKWFAIEHWGIQPDVVVLGKALGAGMPISAVVARQDLMDAWELPAHLFTNGGNAVCCAAALANIAVIQEEKLVERSAVLGRADHGPFPGHAGEVRAYRRRARQGA